MVLFIFSLAVRRVTWSPPSPQDYRRSSPSGARLLALLVVRSFGRCGRTGVEHLFQYLATSISTDLLFVTATTRLCQPQLLEDWALQRTKVYLISPSPLITFVWRQILEAMPRI